MSRYKFRFTIVGIPLLVLISAFAAHAQILNKVTFEGEIHSLSGLKPYSLEVIYRPQDTTNSYPDSQKRWRQVKSISLLLSGKKIKFPESAFQDLKFVHAPTPLTFGASGVVSFDITGGDGELAYKASFFVDEHRLIRRELSRHMQAKPEVVSFAKGE